jgi:hypothetical protein
VIKNPALSELAEDSELDRGADQTARRKNKADMALI